MFPTQHRYPQNTTMPPKSARQKGQDSLFGENKGALHRFSKLSTQQGLDPMEVLRQTKRIQEASNDNWTRCLLLKEKMPDALAVTVAAKLATLDEKVAISDDEFHEIATDATLKAFPEYGTNLDQLLEAMRKAILGPTKKKTDEDLRCAYARLLDGFLLWDNLPLILGVNDAKKCQPISPQTRADAFLGMLPAEHSTQAALQNPTTLNGAHQAAIKAAAHLDAIHRASVQEGQSAAATRSERKRQDYSSDEEDDTAEHGQSTNRRRSGSARTYGNRQAGEQAMGAWSSYNAANSNERSRRGQDGNRPKRARRNGGPNSRRYPANAVMQQPAFEHTRGAEQAAFAAGFQAALHQGLPPGIQPPFQMPMPPFFMPMPTPPVPPPHLPPPTLGTPGQLQSSQPPYAHPNQHGYDTRSQSGNGMGNRGNGRHGAGTHNNANCFNCGEAGHWAKQCPRNTPRLTQRGRKKEAGVYQRR